MADGIVHGDALQLMEALLVQNADAVPGANPKVSADGLHLLHIGQRRDVKKLNVFEVVLRLPPADLGDAGFQVEITGVIRIREETAGVGDAAYLVGKKADDLSLLQREDVSGFGETVQQPVASYAQVIDIGVRQPGILQGQDLHVLVNNVEASGGGLVSRFIVIDSFRHRDLIYG
jgi:hypothetical protein